MSDRFWTEPWPSWARMWYGIAMRALVGVIGAAGALGLFLLAQFGATYKRTTPEWSGEALAILVLSFAVMVGSITLAVRPSRISAMLAGLVLLAVPVVGAAI